MSRLPHRIRPPRFVPGRFYSSTRAAKHKDAPPETRSAAGRSPTLAGHQPCPLPDHASSRRPRLILAFRSRRQAPMLEVFSSPQDKSPARSEGGDEEGDDDVDSEPEEITPPPKGKGKRGNGAEIDKGKRVKTSGGLWMQDQISKIVSFNERSTTSVESFARREDTLGFSIKEVMSIVKECGAAPGTKEHFIASELFTKRAERELFMTMDSAQECFEWLTMKHFVKYGH